MTKYKQHSKKKICIVGAGPLGLSAAYYLSRTQKYNITVLEKSSSAAGLAGSFTLSNGSTLERYYHHIFKTDYAFLSLAKDLNLINRINYSPASTAHYYKNRIYDISNPIKIICSRLLKPANALRFLLASIYLKSGIQRRFKNQSALSGSLSLYGYEATKKIWEPLLLGKFGEYYNKVPMSWLASRIRDRSLLLGYMNGSFSSFYTSLIEACKTNKVNFRFSTQVQSIYEKDDEVLVNNESFSYCLSTIGPYHEKKARLNSDNFEYLGSICVIYEFTFDTLLPYWTNYCDNNSPVLAIINHRALDASKQFKGIYPHYSAAYLSKDSELFKYPDNKIADIFFEPFFNLCPKLTSSLKNLDIKSHVFRTTYSQPLINPDLGLPPIVQQSNRIKRISMHTIYPNDRGQNYSIAMGHAAALDIIKNFGN